MFMEKSVNLFAIKALTIIYCLRRVPRDPLQKNSTFFPSAFLCRRKAHCNEKASYAYRENDCF